VSEDDLPYRPCVGVAVFNREGHVFVGRRIGASNDENYLWQMPQGGIDQGEKPIDAAYRELHEETGIESVELIAEAPEWLKYDLPVGRSKRWSGKYRGQTQRWFAFRFVGDESEIRFDLHGKPEFDGWRWVELDKVPALIIPFKKPVYEDVVRYFAPIVADS